MSQQKRLSYLLLLNTAMVLGLVVVGLVSHSISVLAAGGDFIADSSGIVLGLMAVHLRDKHGHHRAPTYVALVNGLLLLGITAFVMAEAIDRLLTHNSRVHGLPVLIVSLISTGVMVMGVIILGAGAASEDLHMRSVLLDTVSDGLAALSIAIVGGTIFITDGMYWLDSAAAIVIGSVIGFGALKLLRDVFESLQSSKALELSSD